MPIPLAAAGLALSAAKKAAQKIKPGAKGKAKGKYRRRRARLTHGDILELTNIKNILGRTAAANALPYYLGRGRG